MPFSALAQSNQQVCQFGNVYEDLECYEKQINLLKPKINSAYTELVKLDLYDAHKEFEASQKLWLQWVEKDCAFEAAPSSEAQGAGCGLVVAECKYNRYAARLKQMQTVIKELSELKSSQ
ncbi:DUF1311 domain-containing protein [Kingella negevensis]|uniref:lysozyme inhibitor LprI family protein n=1 Tax=Kingella negevensis TaxID=1522312 RepID=UPI0025435AF8|nr:lysozyme inhibitor LprI family protein [Kingella negevensis]MDK4684778.1 DUF1311 domain-containing protein [Kingella negevensis]MDK4707319.1 DUF1311 domain-containing protein [Kingella negevensis]MDK4710203.1 DUF1311 domain-containing protein [Kingella negevensis]WII94370.1 DUF1311 domain-containing protein [Kingella negevensis]